MNNQTDTQDTLSGPEYEARCAALSANIKVVDEYVHDYELDDGENCAYSPNEAERDLITDAIQGLLADEEFVSTFNAWQDLCRRDRTLRAGQSEPVAEWRVGQKVRIEGEVGEIRRIDLEKQWAWVSWPDPLFANQYLSGWRSFSSFAAIGGAGQSPTVPTRFGLNPDNGFMYESARGPWMRYADHAPIPKTPLPSKYSDDPHYISPEEESALEDESRAALRSTLPQTTGDRS